MRAIVNNGRLNAHLVNIHIPRGEVTEIQQVGLPLEHFSHVDYVLRFPAMTLFHMMMLGRLLDSIKTPRIDAPPQGIILPGTGGNGKVQEARKRILLPGQKGWNS